MLEPRGIPTQKAPVYSRTSIPMNPAHCIPAAQASEFTPIYPRLAQAQESRQVYPHQFKPSESPEYIPTRSSLRIPFSTSPPAQALESRKVYPRHLKPHESGICFSFRKLKFPKLRVAEWGSYLVSIELALTARISRCQPPAWIPKPRYLDSLTSRISGCQPRYLSLGT